MYVSQKGCTGEKKCFALLYDTKGIRKFIGFQS